MSGEQVRLQVPPKLYRVHSWITQIISPEGAALNTWNRQLMTSGRSQMVMTGNCGNWHTVVGEICRSPMPETSMDCDSQLVLHPLRNTQPVQIIMHQPRQTTLVFPGPCDQTHRSILNPQVSMYQGVYKFNQANFQEIPGGILRKIQDLFALLRPPHNMGISALPSRIGICGSVISSPTGVQGGAPAENGFWCIWNLKRHI